MQETDTLRTEIETYQKLGEDCGPPQTVCTFHIVQEELKKFVTVLPTNHIQQKHGMITDSIGGPRQEGEGEDSWPP